MSQSGESNGHLHPDAEPEEEKQSPAGEQPLGPEDHSSGGDRDLDEDLFGDGDDGDLEEDDEPDMDESELQKRQELEYEEEHTHHHRTHTADLQIAEVTLQNLPMPYASDGKVKQSNARVVVWSDGSKSLQVGSELFDMVFIPDNQHQSAVTPGSKTASQPSQATPENFPPVQGLTYLFARHDDTQLLEAQASITGQISLRPYSLDSLTHRSLVANRSLNKNQRQTRFHTVTVDPEKQKIEKEMEEARKLKEEKKKENQRARTNDRLSTSNHDGAGARGSRKRKFNARLLSEEDDDLQEENEYDEDDDEHEMDEEEEQDQYMNDNDLDEPKKGSSQKQDKLDGVELDDEKLDQAEAGGAGGEAQDGDAANTQKAGRKKLIIFSEDEDE